MTNETSNAVKERRWVEAEARKAGFETSTTMSVAQQANFRTGNKSLGVLATLAVVKSVGVWSLAVSGEGSPLSHVRRRVIGEWAVLTRSGRGCSIGIGLDVRVVRRIRGQGVEAMERMMREWKSAS